jgi:hypothetical protein
MAGGRQGAEQAGGDRRQFGRQAHVFGTHLQRREIPGDHHRPGDRQRRRQDPGERQLLAEEPADSPHLRQQHEAAQAGDAEAFAVVALLAFDAEQGPEQQGRAEVLGDREVELVRHRRSVSTPGGNAASPRRRQTRSLDSGPAADSTAASCRRTASPASPTTDPRSHADPDRGPAPDNPFARTEPLPYSTPAFDTIRNEHLPAGPARRHARAPRRGASDRRPRRTRRRSPTRSRRWNAAGALLTRVNKVFFNLTESTTNPSDPERAGRRGAAKLAAHQDAIWLDARLFARIEAVFAARERCPIPSSGAWSSATTLVRAQRRAAAARTPSSGCARSTSRCRR